MREKSKSKLSPPIIYEGDTIEDMLNAGMDYLYNTFLKKDVKPKYNGKNIFFDMDKIFRRSIRMPYALSYMHITSLDQSDKYTVAPCVNDISTELCCNNCSLANALFPYQNYGRWECVYRLHRIHWIKEVIELANIHDEHICVFTEEKTDGKKKYTDVNIRYNCGMDDYLVILRERKDVGDYLFVTAFPVVSKSKKMKLDKKTKN